MFSIVIPIYNVEPYIERCVRSVLVQTYRNLEVILIDDCSPDNSLSLAKNVIEESGVQDLKFVYIRHEKNRGLSAARNTGIDVATGEYIYFLDSDDAITPICIEVLAKPLSKEYYDFIIADFETRGIPKSPPKLNFSGKCDNVLQAKIDNQWYAMAVNKLVNLYFLRNNHLYFKEGIIHEDELWSFQLSCVAKSFYGIKEITYLYYIRGDSIMGNVDVQSWIMSRIIIGTYMWDYIDSAGLSEDTLANNYIEKFIQSGHPMFVFSRNMEGYKYYKQTRCKNHRDSRIYRHLSFASLSGFVKYSHYLLPVPIGFSFKVLLRLPFIIKELF